MMKGKVFVSQYVNYCDGEPHTANRSYVSICRKTTNRARDEMTRKKQNAARLLILLLFCAVVAFAPSAQAESAPAIGDLTGDGAISAADAAVLLRGIAFSKINEQTRPDLDLTNNGEINGMDARAVLFYACGGFTDLAAFGAQVSGGLCAERLFDRFCYTGTVDDGMGNHKSDTVSVTIRSGRMESSNYHVADIYVQDIDCFATAFSREKYMGRTETVRAIFDRIPNAIVAMNGDFYSIHVPGPVVRNGVVYEDHVTKDWDIAVLRKSGELMTYEYKTLTKDALLEMDAYQSWVFGPALLDEAGHAKTEFRSRVQPANPRSVIGYYEPGHYSFLTVDGRSESSDGMTMQQLSQLCESLGFTSAYNLDGGQSSVLLAQGGPINDPFRGGRPVSDILVIQELSQY